MKTNEVTNEPELMYKRLYDTASARYRALRAPILFEVL